MKTKSGKPGSDTSVEVARISQDGFWLLLDQRELFVPFDQFPWFKNAPASKIQRVERPHPDQLSWPDLDIDLALESIEFPERYPLKWRDSRS